MDEEFSGMAFDIQPGPYILLQVRFDEGEDGLTAVLPTLLNSDFPSIAFALC